MLIAAVQVVLDPAGILLRNDAAVRRREGLTEEVTLAFGDVPDEVEVRECGVRYLAAPWTGQKTGAFLDQRVNRLRAGQLTPPGARTLDCFSYHGSFALHLAQRAGQVVALDQNGDALARGVKNARLNHLTNIEWLEADAFDALRRFHRARQPFDLIVVDPPAFAKSKSAVEGALRGYKDINLGALRLLSPGGFLLSTSCSYHVPRQEFMRALTAAAEDSGRRVTLLEHLGQAPDHPELLTVPETAYLKGAVLRVE